MVQDLTGFNPPNLELGVRAILGPCRQGCIDGCMIQRHSVLSPESFSPVVVDSQERFKQQVRVSESVQSFQRKWGLKSLPTSSGINIDAMGSRPGLNRNFGLLSGSQWGLAKLDFCLYVFVFVFVFVVDYICTTCISCWLCAPCHLQTYLLFYCHISQTQDRRLCG